MAPTRSGICSMRGDSSGLKDREAIKKLGCAPWGGRFQALMSIRLRSDPRLEFQGWGLPLETELAGQVRSLETHWTTYREKRHKQTTDTHKPPNHGPCALDWLVGLFPGHDMNWKPLGAAVPPGCRPDWPAWALCVAARGIRPSLRCWPTGRWCKKSHLLRIGHGSADPKLSPAARATG